MMKPRNYFLLIVLAIALLGPGSAMAADETDATGTVPTLPSDADPSGTETSPIAIDQEAIDAALADQAGEADDDKGIFEKASDFVTDNAPWFIIGIIVLAAIVAGILIMRGRPRSSRAVTGSRKASAGHAQAQSGQAPSAAEVRRRKRAAVQRSREAERLRRKAEIENRKAARRGEPPTAAVPPAAPAPPASAAMAAGGSAAAGLDPVEAEKQGARDQAVAAGAMARFGAPAADTAIAGVPAVAAPDSTFSAPPAVPTSPAATVPAPVSPSQTAPAAGVITPGQETVAEPYQAGQEAGSAYEPDPEPAYEPDPEPLVDPVSDPEATYQPAATDPGAESPAGGEAETSIMHEPSLESPGPDAAVGNAAGEFLAAGAAGAAGGFAAARARRTDAPPEVADEMPEPVIAPEPGMTVEHALVEPDPFVPEPEAPVEPEAGAVTPQAEPVRPGAAAPGVEDAEAAAAEERLRAKVAEIKASQGPSAPPAASGPEVAAAISEPAPLGPDADLSPGLAAVERKLSENSEERDRALRDAEERLRRVEQRAEDAERRAAFAERLAQLKVEESDREKRLNNVVSGIDRAEQRAREAESRAEAAERAAAAALEQSDLKPAGTTPPPSTQAVPEATGAPESPGNLEETRADDPEPGPPAPEPADPAPPAPQRKGLFGGSPSASSGGSDSLNLNSATFEELRETGLSVTQATRILAYRERFGGYSSIEDLEKVPGFPEDLIESLKGRITV